MPAIKLKTVERSWKPYCGRYAQVRLGVTYLKNCVLGKQLIVALIAGRKLAYGRIFFSLRKETDTEWVFTDGSYVRCHQHASGARRGEDRAIGRSRGGATTKIHLSCDADGYPLHFKITGGEVHDSQVAGELIDMIRHADYFIADKGYDSQAIRDKACMHDMIPIIPKRSNTKAPNPEFDSYLYKLRHLVENMFARLKHFRSIATRYEKLARNFKSMLYLACTIVHCKMN